MMKFTKILCHKNLELYSIVLIAHWQFTIWIINPQSLRTKYCAKRLWCSRLCAKKYWSHESRILNLSDDSVLRDCDSNLEFPISKEIQSVLRDWTLVILIFNLLGDILCRPEIAMIIISGFQIFCRGFGCESRISDILHPFLQWPWTQTGDQGEVSNHQWIIP